MRNKKKDVCLTLENVSKVFAKVESDEAKKAARQRGVAILSSLHDLNQALCLGDKFFLLRDGAVRYAGDESVLTSEVIGDIFDIQSRIITVDGKKVILGGKYYEES